MILEIYGNSGGGGAQSLKDFIILNKNYLFGSFEVKIQYFYQKQNRDGII